MSVQISMWIEIDEHSVKPHVHVGPFGVMKHEIHPSSGYYENTLAANKEAGKVLVKVLDFAEGIKK